VAKTKSYMIVLNLIPTNKKRELYLTQIYLVTKYLIILILLLANTVAIILLLTKLILQNYFAEVVNQTTLTTQYANTFNRDLKGFNQKLFTVEKIQKEYISWLDFIINFSQLIPKDIGLYNLTLNENKILINGFAKTRDQLLALEGNLKKSEIFSEVIVPLENLLKKENIDFTLKAAINLDQLKD
jgi:Tfp pilus assembly protein PilN